MKRREFLGGFGPAVLVKPARADEAVE